MEVQWEEACWYGLRHLALSQNVMSTRQLHQAQWRIVQLKRWNLSRSSGYRHCRDPCGTTKRWDAGKVSQGDFEPLHLWTGRWVDQGSVFFLTGSWVGKEGFEPNSTLDSGWWLWRLFSLSSESIWQEALDKSSIFSTRLLGNPEMLSTFHTVSVFFWAFGSKILFLHGFSGILWSSGGVPGSGGSVSWRSHGLKMEDRRCRHRPDVEHNGMVKDRQNFPTLMALIRGVYYSNCFCLFTPSIDFFSKSTVWIHTRMFTPGKLCRMTMWWKWKRRLMKMIFNGKKCASFRNNFNAWSIAFVEEDQMRLWITTGREQVFDVASPKTNGAKYDLIFINFCWSTVRLLCECMAKNLKLYISSEQPFADVNEVATC